MQAQQTRARNRSQATLEPVEDRGFRRDDCTRLHETRRTRIWSWPLQDTSVRRRQEAQTYSKLQTILFPYLAGLRVIGMGGHGKMRYRVLNLLLKGRPDYD